MLTTEEKHRNQLILQTLERVYGGAGPELVYADAFQLLVAVILSAQCTDQQVNRVTASLFRAAPNVSAMATLSVPQIEELIHGVGLYRNKAKNISLMTQQLLREFNGQVPSQRSDLERLPGVGRKTASVVLSVAFGVPALAVDTHVFRVSNRTGLVKAKDPNQTEKQLCEQIPMEKWSDAHHWLIHHGRYCCKARIPQCDICPVESLCPKRISDIGEEYNHD